MVLATFGLAANNVADTVMTFLRPINVTIAEGAGGVEVDVVDDDTVKTVFKCEAEGNVRYHTSQQFSWNLRESPWYVVFGGFSLGFVNTPGSDGGISPEGGKSLELGIFHACAVSLNFAKWWDVTFGIGFDWRNYRSTKGLMYVPDGGKIHVSHFPEGTDYRFSRIKIFTLQFPLLLKRNFNAYVAGFRPNFAFGPIFCLNTHGSVKSSWREADGTVSTFTDNHIGQRKFTIDFMARISLGGVGVYVRYSPYKTLTGGGVPDFRPLSAGITIGF